MYVNVLHYCSLQPEIFNIQKYSVKVSALHTAYTAALVGWTDSTEGSDRWPHWAARGAVSLTLLQIHFNSLKETHRLLMPCCPRRHKILFTISVEEEESKEAVGINTIQERSQEMYI